MQVPGAFRTLLAIALWAAAVIWYVARGDWTAALVLSVPLAVVLALLTWFTRRGYRAAVSEDRSSRGLCLRCGYDLRASRGRCPECGTAAPPPVQRAADDLETHPMQLSQKLAALGITLPAVPGPFGAYVPARRAGSLVFVAGQLPMREGKLMATGPVPSRCPVDDARAAARQCVINALAAVKAVGIDPEALAGVVRVGAFVCSDADFTGQPQVANAASELLLELFGDAGKHARAAVGVNTLPLGASVEIEFLFEVKG